MIPEYMMKAASEATGVSVEELRSREADQPTEEATKLEQDDQVVETQDQRAFCKGILTLLGIDDITEEQIAQIWPPVHELFRSRKKWRDLAKSQAKHLAAKDAEIERLREALASIVRAFEKCPYDFDSCRSVPRIAKEALQQEPTSETN